MHSSLHFWLFKRNIVFIWNVRNVLTCYLLCWMLLHWNSQKHFVKVVLQFSQPRKIRNRLYLWLLKKNLCVYSKRVLSICRSLHGRVEWPGAGGPSSSGWLLLGRAIVPQRRIPHSIQHIFHCVISRISTHVWEGIIIAKLVDYSARNLNYFEDFQLLFEISLCLMLLQSFGIQNKFYF